MLLRRPSQRALRMRLSVRRRRAVHESGTAVLLSREWRWTVHHRMRLPLRLEWRGSAERGSARETGASKNEADARLQDLVVIELALSHEIVVQRRLEGGNFDVDTFIGREWDVLHEVLP